MKSLSPPSPMPKIVLVTGANGYIGASLIKTLLEEGYSVRGTLRDKSISDETQTNFLMAMPNASEHLELVPLELEGPESEFRRAVQDVEWVFHVASPVSLRMVKDEQTIIRPAMTGTLNMLKAANDTDTVQKFVMTSSIAAIVSGLQETYTEDDWAMISPKSTPYFKSKKLTEEAAWKFIEDNKPKFTLSVINPGITIGPLPSANAKSSTEILARVFQGGSVMNLFCATVDIRDVVRAHIQAAMIPEAAGKRFILVQSDGGELFLPEISAILAKEFAPLGYNISTTPTPNWIVWLLSWFIPELAGLYPMIDNKIHFDNSRSRKILGLEYIPAEQTIIDGGYSFIEHGMVPTPSVD